MSIPEDALRTLRDRFVTRCAGQLDVLKRVYEDNSLSIDDGELLKIAHSLAGAGGTFGFPDISARASELETLLISDAAVDAPVTRDALKTLIVEMEAKLP